MARGCRKLTVAPPEGTCARASERFTTGFTTVIQDFLSLIRDPPIDLGVEQRQRKRALGEHCIVEGREAEFVTQPLLRALDPPKFVFFKEYGTLVKGTRSLL